MIYVTVGTMHLEFSRLIRKMDEIARVSEEKTIIQTGMNSFLPENCEHFDFKSREEVEAIQQEARVVVAHAGIGSVLDALKAERPLIVVPRLKRFGEHNNDHQLDLARAVERRGWGRLIMDINDLSEACAHPPPAHKNYSPAKADLIQAVRNAIETGISKP